MNWRIIVGLALLLLGIRVFYSAYIVAANGKVVTDSSTARIGSIVWILVGVFLIVKGMSRKEA